MVEEKRFKEIYLSEAGRHVEHLNRALLKLEKNPNQLEPVNKLFAEMHALKSMSAAMEYNQIVSLCHAFEDVLDAIRKKKIKAGEVVDLLFEGIDALEATLKALRSGKEELDTAEITEKLSARGGSAFGGKNVKIPTSAIAESGSRSSEASIGTEKPKDIKTEPSVAEDFERIQAIEVKVERLDRLMNLSEELLTTKLRLDRTALELQNPELTAISESFDRLIADLQYNVMQSRTVPLGFVFDRFPRMIRDLAKLEKKEVDLQMEGREIELDRSVVDEIGQSLVHLLRNAVDHGIEAPAVRAKAGKPSQGTIKVSARRTRASAVIEVSDDGAGIAPQDLPSIFLGHSTAKEVTTISGRGFGMQIVKNKIESLGGSVKVKSDLGRGAAFTLDVPLTLAVIRTLFLEVASRTYGMPLASVDRLVTVNLADIKGMLDSEAIVLEGEDVPVLRLRELFGIDRVEGALAPLERQPIAVVRVENDRLGLLVDAFASTQETVIKPLSRLVKENKYFAGSTIIGSGEAVLILDVAGLVEARK